MIGKEARFSTESTEFYFWSDNFPFRFPSASWLVLISSASISSRANSLTGQLKGMSLCKYTNHMLIVTDIWNIYLKHLFCRTYRLDKYAKSVSCLTSSCTVFNKFFEILEVSVWKKGLCQVIVANPIQWFWCTMLDKMLQNFWMWPKEWTWLSTCKLFIQHTKEYLRLLSLNCALTLVFEWAFLTNLYSKCVILSHRSACLKPAREFFTP